METLWIISIIAIGATIISAAWLFLNWKEKLYARFERLEKHTGLITSDDDKDLGCFRKQNN